MASYEYQYALEFGFNLGAAGPSLEGSTGMMWGMGVRKRRDGSTWGAWEHFDPRDKLVDGSEVGIYVVNIGLGATDSSVAQVEITSKKAFDAPAEQTVAVPWDAAPLLAPGSVDGSHSCSGLVLTDVQHIRLGSFNAICQDGLRDSRFVLGLSVTISWAGGQAYFSQDPELVVGGDSGFPPQLPPRPEAAS